MADYTIDWSKTNVDGKNTLHGPDGDIHVRVSTPKNAQGKEWFVENGMLKNWDVRDPASADVRFSKPVENVEFTLVDVDSIDKVTIMAKDADGSLVEIDFENTGKHVVDGNMVTGKETDHIGPKVIDGNPHNIDITIPGPVSTFWIVLDDGPARAYSGTVIVSNIHFDIAPELDGIVDGTAGNDLIDAAYDHDPDGDRIDASDAILSGEAPNDDIVDAGAGNDIVRSGEGDDEVFGGSGNDMIFSGNGGDVIYAGAGNDKVEASHDADIVFGGAGDDTLWAGGRLADTISGGSGNDEVSAGNASDLLTGGKGDDTITARGGDDDVFGGAGSDTIMGGSGNDTLIGGNVVFDGTLDFNDLDAGELLDGQYVANGVTITSADARHPVMAFDTANPTGGDGDLATNNLGKVLILSEDRDGTDPDDNAGGGTFHIDFDGPADVSALTLLDADGGAWVKYYDGDGALLKQVDVKTPDNGQHVIHTDLHGVCKIEVKFASSGAIDNLTYSIDRDTSDGADVIDGGDGEDYIEGNAGNDRIDGGKDNDEIYGGAGNDRIFGNDGDDLAFGGAGNDNMGGSDRGNDEYYGGAGNDMMETSFGDDTLYGGAGDDNLWASADNDLVFGGTGNDSSFGGQGDDTVYGDDGNDTLSGGSGSDSVFGGAGDDVIEGFGAYKDDKGTDGPDALFGGDDADVIKARAGDVVDGGAGVTSGEDHDTLDITGQGAYYLAGPDGTGAPVPDSNGNGIDGTVVFVDDQGKPTGDTIRFVEIEKIVGDKEVNRGPDAVDDMATVEEDGMVVIDVLSNDTDPDGDPLTIIKAVSPKGQVDINPDGTLKFTPDPDFNGMTTVDYVISDGKGGTDKAWVKVNVTPVNDAPDAVDDMATTDEDTPITLTVLDNDSDPDGDPLTIIKAVSPKGDVTINPDGTLTFVPDPDFSGMTTVDYVISDGNGGTDKAWVKVTVNPVNDGPDAVDDIADTVELTPVTIDLLANDTDPEGDPLTITSVSVPTEQGTVVDNGDGTVTFTPADGFTGEAEITYDITDGNGGTDTATATVTVGEAEDPFDDECTFELINHTSNDGTYGMRLDNLNEPGKFTLDFEGDGAAMYMTTSGDEIRIFGTALGSDGAQYRIDFTYDNVAQAIGDDDVLVDDHLQMTNTGTLERLDESGAVAETYDLTDKAREADGYTFRLGDRDDDAGHRGAPGDSGWGWLTVNGEVSGLRDFIFEVGNKVDGPLSPEATNDRAETDEDVPVIINVLGNDFDPEGQDLSVIDATSPDGEVTINPDGTLTLTPAPNFNGDTTINYVITDPDGNQDSAVVTVTVNPINDAPEANPDSDTTDFNTPVLINLLANDLDVDGDDLTVVEASVPPEQGSLTDNGDGTFTFTPALGFEGEATVSYTIKDEEGLTDSSTHTITVNDAPLDGTVQGTAGDDLIDVDYLGDPDGDRVDNEDAIIPGDAPNDDEIYGFDGDDTILAGAGDDRVFGGADNDVIKTDDGDDFVDGGTGDDMVFGGAGNDELIGGEGNDKLEGSGGDDTLIGGEGDDDLWGGANNDIVEGGEGDDTVAGGGGDDTIDGGAGNDTIDGGNNDDSILGGDGNDVVDGGSGDDVIDTSGYTMPLPDVGYPGVYPADADPNNDLDTVFGGIGDDSIMTGDDNDTIFGGKGDDTIDAGIDDDFVEGGAGDDTVVGSEGNDEIYGEDGDDTLYGGLVTPGPGDILNLPDDIDGNGDSNSFGEDLVTDNNNDTLFGGDGNDTIFGADDDDTLFGGADDDVLDGGIDDDELYGDTGEDTVIGGQGADSQFGGLGNDLFLVHAPGDGAGDVIVGGEDPDLDGDGQSDDVDVLDLTGSNVDFITYVDGDPEAGTVTFQDGSTLTFSEIENVIPCFTPGTTIATPRGERLVEELREGDRIITRDNGIQEIRWVGRKDMTGKQLVSNPHLKPILIKAGSLGNGLPERDMLVSPNHRMLVASEKTQLYFDEREVLAAAKHLVGAPGIHEVDVMGTSYIHFMFDRHEVVLSNGSWTESFQPGDYSLKGIGNAQRTEILELFPELATKPGLEGYQSARRALKKHEAKLLVK